jgi:L-rhamnose mutarotase
MLWPEQRQADLTKKIKRLVESPSRAYCYLHSTILQENLPKSLSQNPYAFEDTNRIVGQSWKQVGIQDSYQEPCFYIITAHGSDNSQFLWELKAKSHRDSVFALWYWDNHVAYNDNYKVALATDLIFISHNLGVPGYLTNPVSAVAEHVPLCCAQFGANEIHQEIALDLHAPRSNKGLFNYVVYENAPRAQMMRNWELELGDLAEFKLMPSNDRTRYWDLTRHERFKEWSNYKCSVIVPLVKDLSTRVFDSLASGQIPIVPEEIQDLDIVCSRELQTQLGIVRIPALTSQDLAVGIEQAVANFDALGTNGVIARSEYVIQSGLLGHRLLQMLQTIKAISNESSHLVFGNGPNGIGAYLNR